MQKEISVVNHLKAYTKLLADLTNVDVVIEDEDKTLILLSSLPDEEYETFVLTLINGKTSLSYNDVTGAPVKYELRKGKASYSNVSGKALTVRAKGPNQQGVMESRKESPNLKSRR